MDFRIGNGFDVHPFKRGRKLFLGGVQIKYPVGLEGHSDADVLTHAVCDSLLGAMGEGDIGKLFPNTDMKYRNKPSKYFLEAICGIVQKKKWKIINIDCTVLAEKPKISSYAPLMKKIISKSLGISPDRVNIKATTCEKLGFIGRQEGIACLASALIVKK
jgi:2-C-methyl-D-erythritol 2,4-cyclodiphosphate synthase